MSSGFLPRRPHLAVQRPIHGTNRLTLPLRQSIVVGACYAWRRRNDAIATSPTGSRRRLICEARATANRAFLPDWPAFQETNLDIWSKKRLTSGGIVEIGVGRRSKDAVLRASSRMVPRDTRCRLRPIQASQKNGSWYLTMNATTDALKNAPGYKYDKGAASWVPA
jgi:hypothetical protein